MSWLMPRLPELFNWCECLIRTPDCDTHYNVNGHTGISGIIIISHCGKTLSVEIVKSNISQIILLDNGCWPIVFLGRVFFFTLLWLCLVFVFDVRLWQEHIFFSSIFNSHYLQSKSFVIIFQPVMHNICGRWFGRSTLWLSVNSHDWYAILPFVLSSQFMLNTKREEKRKENEISIIWHRHGVVTKHAERKKNK